MNKVAISKTRICYWSDDHDCYIVESPLFDRIAGVGDTPEQAQDVFERLLDDGYLAYLEGRVPGYDKPGRPSKGAISVSFRLQPDTKESLAQLAKTLECSQGEAIDYLVYCHKIEQLEQKQALKRQNKSNRRKKRLA